MQNVIELSVVCVLVSAFGYLPHFTFLSNHPDLLQGKRRAVGLHRMLALIRNLFLLLYSGRKPPLLFIKVLNTC